jgi:hypothetical protein
MHVGTGKATEVNSLLEGLARGRDDHEFFGAFFLDRPPHPSQIRYLEEAEATINVLATANRFGKTTLLSHRHCHRCIYKIGAEPKYLEADRSVNLDRFVKTRYQTIHAAHEWETAKLVWDEMHKLIGECPRLRAFIVNAPKSLPPHIDFVGGAKWKFRSLGDNASGIDGNSFYYVSIDEAGWNQKLEEMTDNVIRVRVADVQGIIDFVGTFKPGIGQDFFKYAVRASAYSGAGIAFAHQGDVDDEGEGGLDVAIRRYLAEIGIDIDEYAQALGIDIEAVNPLWNLKQKQQDAA